MGHHWQIEAADGPTSPGVCLNCGERTGVQELGRELRQLRQVFTASYCLSGKARDRLPWRDQEGDVARLRPMAAPV